MRSVSTICIDNGVVRIGGENMNEELRSKADMLIIIEISVFLRYN